MKLVKGLVFFLVLISCVNAFGQKNKRNLETGTYIATGSEVLSDSYTGFSSNRPGIKIKITIKSIDEDGNVKAHITIENRKGTLSGEITSENKLRLEGGLIDDKDTVFETEFSATIVTKNNSLTAGKYISRSGIFTMKGEFNLAVMKDE